MGSAISAVLPLQNRYAMSVVYPYVNHMVLFLPHSAECFVY